MHWLLLLLVPGLEAAGCVTQVEFFKGIPLERGSIALTLTPEGRPKGEAYVEFPTEEAQKEALGRHKDAMGERYIELFLSTKANMIQVSRQASDTFFCLSHA